MAFDERIVITGVGLTSPIGNNIKELRSNLLEGVSGITHQNMRHMGQVAIGLCDFDEFRYQKKKARRRGTRAGSIAIYCANEAIQDAKIDWESMSKDRVGVYLGITEHGNVETENEIHELYQNDLNVDFWSHHHNPRTVANSPAGEVTLNLKITGPHYTIGAACAAGNLGPIQAIQMLKLKEVDMALAGGVSESAHTFGIFAAFKSQGALGDHENPCLATRPLDKERNGIVVSEGGCVYVFERLESALKRGAHIYGHPWKLPTVEVVTPMKNYGQTIDVTKNFDNGVIAYQGKIKNGKRDAQWTFYFTSGALLARGNYEKDIKEGPWVFFYPNGKKKSQGHYHENKKEGPWIEWDRQGNETMTSYN